MEHLNRNNNRTEAFSKALGLNKLNTSGDYSDSYYGNVQTFLNNHFMEWIKELARNKRSFSPFNLNADFNSLVEGAPIPTGYFKPGIDDSYINGQLNSVEKSFAKDTPNVKARFILTMYTVANAIFNEKLKALPSKAK